MLCTRHGAAAVCVPCAFPVVSGSSRSSTTRCPAAEVHLIFPRTCSSWLPTAGCFRTGKDECGQGSLAHEQCVWQVFTAGGLSCPTSQFDIYTYPARMIHSWQWPPPMMLECPAAISRDSRLGFLIICGCEFPFQASRSPLLDVVIAPPILVFWLSSR